MPQGGAGPAARTALAERYNVAAAADLDDWTIAVNLTRRDCRIIDSGLRFYAEWLGARAVLARARQLVGPLRGATRVVREPLREVYAAELDVETTLENVLGKPHPEPGDWIVNRREERRHEIVLMIDTSLSMAGEKMALAAVATAVMALHLRPGDLSVVLFADEARVVARLHEEVPVPELVRRMLATRCGGATNVAAALELGHAQLARGRNPRRSAVLVSDGLYTAGADPRRAAARFRRLHVLLTQEQTVAGATDSARARSWIAPKRLIGRDVARAGGGQLVPVDRFASLPRCMLDLADHLLR
ncbi:MAG: VWA domain-containing protein [Thermoleophilia bacterium]